MSPSVNWQLVKPGSALPFGSFVSVIGEMSLLLGVTEVNEKRRKRYLLTA